MSVKSLIFLMCSGNLINVGLANEFLRKPNASLIEHVSEQDIRTSLLDEVEGSLGAGTAGNRLSQMEAILAPIIAALPKNEHGNLGHSAVRYALHRLFVLRHGWVIKGLGTDGGALDSSSPAGVLKDQVPSYITGLFEQRLAGKGFGLHELAVLAATIEHLIHNEAVSKLGSAFNVHQLSVLGPIGELEATDVLDTYMMAFILGENLNNLTLTEAKELVAEMPEIFLAWRDTQKFVHNVKDNVTKEAGSVDFASLAKTAEAVGEQFGSFQDFECQQLKQKLVSVEYRGTGRVKLADFYKPALDGSWTFQESVGYLRSLGLLDETDASQPSVMIANYIVSHANCIASSGFYSVCCKNECEGLLGHLEQRIGTYEAAPATISSLIENLASSTSAAQKVPDSLLQRLNEIAATHGGKVPLHGRLFAQWMHHMYPRECPFPHISGTTDTKLPEEWMDESGGDVTATDEEMMQYVSQSGNATDIRETDLSVEELMPWSTEEELFVVRPIYQAPDSSTSSTARSVVLLAAASSIAFALTQSVKSTSRSWAGEAVPQKFTV